VTLFSASAFHSVDAGGVVSAQRVFVPVDLDLCLLTLIFKLIRVEDQARLLCEFGANPFSGSCHPLWNASEHVSTISPIWRVNVNGCQMITVDSGVSGPKFRKFFTRCRQDIIGVNASIRFPILLSLVVCESQEGRRVADFGRFPKIGCHGNVP